MAVNGKDHRLDGDRYRSGGARSGTDAYDDRAGGLPRVVHVRPGGRVDRDGFGHVSHRQSDLYAGTTVLETILLPTGASELRARYIGDGARAPSTPPVVPHTVLVTAADGFAQPVEHGGMNDPRAIAVADFNNDDVEDAIVADNLLS